MMKDNETALKIQYNGTLPFTDRTEIVSFSNNKDKQNACTYFDDPESHHINFSRLEASESFQIQIQIQIKLLRDFRQNNLVFVVLVSLKIIYFMRDICIYNK